MLNVNSEEMIEQTTKKNKNDTIYLIALHFTVMWCICHRQRMKQSHAYKDKYSSVWHIHIKHVVLNVDFVSIQVRLWLNAIGLNGSTLEKIARGA